MCRPLPAFQEGKVGADCSLITHIILPAARKIQVHQENRGLAGVRMSKCSRVGRHVSEAHLYGIQEAIQDVQLCGACAVCSVIPALAQQLPDVAVELPHAPVEHEERWRRYVRPPWPDGAQVCLSHYRQVQLRKHLHSHCFKL